MSTENTYRDWYRVLDLPFTASESDIKQRYRHLMLEWHPDKRDIQTGYELHRTQELNEAYAVLRDPAKRAEYDKTYNAEAKKRADRLKAAANEAYRTNSFSDAVKLFSEAISIDPSNAVIYSNRSMAYGALADWASARSDAERAVALNPSYMKGHYNLTRALVKLGLPHEADAVLTAALLASPNDQNLLKLRKDLDIYLKKLTINKAQITAPTENFGYLRGAPAASVPPHDHSPSLPSLTPPRKISPTRSPPSDEDWLGKNDPFVRITTKLPTNPTAPPPPGSPKSAAAPAKKEPQKDPQKSTKSFFSTRPSKWRVHKSYGVIRQEEIAPKNAS